MKEITINYLPQEYQRMIHEDSTRYKVLNIGRRGGKTEGMLNHLIMCAVEDPGLYWYVGPSYRQAKSIAWVRLKDLLKPAREFWKFNEQELYAEEINTKSRIELKGSDNEESLLGVGLKGVVFDESAMIGANVWPRIVRPMLADSKGWAIFISTPKGKNWFYDLYKLGCGGNKDWKSWKYPTSVNKYIDKGEIEEMRKDMPELLFSQEVMAEFLDDSTGVFKGVSRCVVGEYKEPIVGRSYVMGVDLAKTYDFTVLTVIDRLTRELVAFERFQDIKWSEQKLRIQDLAFKYNNAICLLDSTGVGDPILEDLQSSNISVEGYKFNNTSKIQLIDNLSIAIERRLITFPDEENLVKELQAFEYILTPAGNVKYEAPQGKHDDCVISLGLAVWNLRHELKESQVLRKDEIILSAQDVQGMGERVEEETEEVYVGY